MKIPGRSPEISKIIGSKPIDSSADTIRYAKEYNEKYLHWDDLRHRELGGSNRMDVWRMMKIMRNADGLMEDPDASGRFREDDPVAARDAYEDITHFIRYNLKMVSEAIDALDTYLKRKMEGQEETMRGLEGRGLSCRQSQILKDMMRDGEPVSQYEPSVKYQMTIPTIRRDLIKPMDMGMVKASGKDGHRQLYVYDPKG